MSMYYAPAPAPMYYAPPYAPPYYGYAYPPEYAYATVPRYYYANGPTVGTTVASAIDRPVSATVNTSTAVASAPFRIAAAPFQPLAGGGASPFQSLAARGALRVKPTTQDNSRSIPRKPRTAKNHRRSVRK